MMDVVGTRSHKHFWQLRYAGAWLAKNEVGCGGEPAGLSEMVDVEICELRRRRKGMLGNRYSGKAVVGEFGMAAEYTRSITVL